MAGTFTHWMVVEQVLDQYKSQGQGHPLFPTIMGKNHYVCLGAVGPDYPYLTDLFDRYLRIHSWADRMHYEKSGEFARLGIERLLTLTGEAFDTCLAWFCGYASHLITDAVIHPVVQAIVGPYIFNADDHRHCEMTQDTFIFQDIKGVELSYGGYPGLFTMCSDPADKNKIDPRIRDFWIPILEANHPSATQYFPRIDPDRWHNNFLSRISSAADPMPIFRHFGEAENIAYKKTGELTDEEKTRYLTNVNLPGNKTGTFKENAFNNAVNRLIETWDNLFVDIENKKPEGCASYIHNCDLDTGVDVDKQVYWP